MSLFFFTLALALGEFFAGAFFITIVVAVLLALGGVIMAGYLLFPPVRKNLDLRMDRHEPDSCTDTLAFVDAETEKYRHQHRKAPQWRTNGDVMREPAIQPGEAVHVTNLPLSSNFKRE